MPGSHRGPSKATINTHLVNIGETNAGLDAAKQAQRLAEWSKSHHNQAKALWSFVENNRVAALMGETTVEADESKMLYKETNRWEKRQVSDQRESLLAAGKITKSELRPFQPCEKAVLPTLFAFHTARKKETAIGKLTHGELRRDIACRVHAVGDRSRGVVLQGSCILWEECGVCYLARHAGSL